MCLGCLPVRNVPMVLVVLKVQTNRSSQAFRALLKNQQFNGNTASCLPGVP